MKQFIPESTSADYWKGLAFVSFWKVLWHYCLQMGDLKTFLRHWFFLRLDTFLGETLSGEILVGWKYWFVEIFDTKQKIRHFCRRKISPNKSKSVSSWSTNEPKREKSHLNKFWLSYRAELCRAKFSSLFKKFAR